LSLKELINNATVADRILFLILIVLSFSGIIFLKEALPQKKVVHIEAGGKPVYILPIENNRIISVDGPEGKTFIEIKNHMVRVTASPCPNKLCVQQGWIKNGVIICIPNKVIVTIDTIDKGTRAFDATTG
jgi:hypothetical protein